MRTDAAAQNVTVHIDGAAVGVNDGMSVAAAELPQMSRVVGTDEEIFAALRKRMQRGLRLIAFFVIPSVVAFIAIGKALVAALYQGGHFTSADTIFVWYTLIGSTVGMLAVTLGRLYSSAFYALRDPRTPLRFAMVRVALTGALGWIFAIPLRPLMLSALAAIRSRSSGSVLLTYVPDPMLPSV